MASYLSPDFEIVECPRDAMQGWAHHIPTHTKVAYLNALLKVGFDTLDFGSFVSAKAIPQLADTREVLNQIDVTGSSTKLLAIIANLRGAEEASSFGLVNYLGFPFSISNTFQLRNTNKTIEQSISEVNKIQDVCVAKGKELVVYISMGFGNPYGDEYNEDIVYHWVSKLSELGIRHFSIADTVGVAVPSVISSIFTYLLPAFSSLKIGAHFHSAPDTWYEKIDAAYNAGCRRFDSSVKGIGGCPFAEDVLVGNIATEHLVGFASDKKLNLNIDLDALMVAEALASSVFV